MSRNTPRHDNDIVLCCTLSNIIEAQMAQNLLNEQSIPSTLDNAIFGSSVYPVGDNYLGGIRLMVFQRDLSRARTILSDFIK